jgi:carbon monoxide dehydrogenase subunit G
MAVIETSIVIDAPVEKVFGFATYQVDRLQDWFVGIAEIQATPDYPEVGSQLEVTYKTSGLTLKATGTIQELQPNKKYVARYTGMATGDQTWTYESLGNQTRVTLHFDYKIIGGGIGKVLDMLVVERQNKKNAEESLANLKRLVEAL